MNFMSLTNTLRITFIFLFFYQIGYTQNTPLPNDLRQHNLGIINPEIANPALSTLQYRAHKLNNWTRWQWQGVDADPTTMFVNYSFRFSENNTAGAGFFQNNDLIYSHKGAYFNYAHNFRFSHSSTLALGLNIYAFGRKSLNTLPNNPDIDIPQLRSTDEFVMQFAPGAYFKSGNLGLGLSSENLIETISNGDNKSNHDVILMGLVDYNIPLKLFGSTENTYLQPKIYFKSIPNYDSQLGLTALLSTSKFWVQGGYNSYYGISAGAGVQILKSISIGALIESGLSSAVQNEDASIELVASIALGRTYSNAAIEEVIEENVEKIATISEEESQAKNTVQEKTIIETTKEIDKPLEKVIKEEAVAVIPEKVEEIKVDKVQDAIVAKPEETKRVTKGHYEEVTTVSGQVAGYYLIANVFGTKKYLDLFKNTLKKRGLSPDSFYRDSRKLNYVYLKRYNSLLEAEKARDSKFKGAYTGKLWIFRIKE